MEDVATVDLNGFTADRVMAVRCDRCNDRLDTSQLNPLERIPCPGCGHPIYIPVRVGDFLLLRRLGHGGQGSVYGGWDITLHRTVALKVMIPPEGEKPDWATLEAEAIAAAKLNHPHVAQVYTLGYHRGQPFLVMELVRGRSLDEFTVPGEQMNAKFVFGVALQIGEGLAQAAEVNLLHSDIKPENIMISPQGGAKLVDFGLAGIEGTGSGAGGKVVWGSPYYVAPERLQNKPASIRSDMYSLGASIYHILTGAPPFTGKTVNDIMMARLSRRPASLRMSRPDLPPEAEALLSRMMATEPGRRHPTYSSLISDMRRVLEVMGGGINIGEFAAERFQTPSATGGKLKTMTLPLLRLTGALRPGNKMPVPKRGSAQPLTKSLVNGATAMIKGATAALVGGHGGNQEEAVPSKKKQIRTAPPSRPAEEQSHGKHIRIKGAPGAVHSGGTPSRSATGASRLAASSGGGESNGAGPVFVILGIIVLVVVGIIIAALVAAKK